MRLFTFLTILFILSCNNDTNEHVTNITIEKKQDCVSKSAQSIDKETDNRQKIKFNCDKNTLIGTIIDPDGYTNLREKPHAKSIVLSRINKERFFLYNPSNSSNWFLVEKLDGTIGYVHKSRIKEVLDDNLIIHKYATDKEEIDQTITHIDSLQRYLDGFPFGFEIIGKDFKQEYKDSLSITLSDNTAKVTLKMIKFIPSQHRISYDKNSPEFITAIDGDEVNGTDGDMPLYETESITIADNENIFDIPKKHLKNLFEPNLEYMIVSRIRENQLAIQLFNGDAAGAYSVLFIIKNGQIRKRILYFPF